MFYFHPWGRGYFTSGIGFVRKIVVVTVMRRTIPKCKRCNVKMKKGVALQNGVFSMPDFVGDTGKERGCTVSADSLKVKLVRCWKCPKCGNSIEIKPKQFDPMWEPC